MSDDWTQDSGMGQTERGGWGLFTLSIVVLEVVAVFAIWRLFA